MALKNIVLMRHGEAGWNAVTDDARELTVRGHQQVAENLNTLKESFIPQVILHSPYKRAIQTALIAEDIFPNTPMRSLDAITPEGEASQVTTLLDGLQEDNILVITHNPLITYLMHNLVHGKRPVTHSELPVFTTASIGWIQAQSIVAGLCNLHLFITND